MPCVRLEGAMDIAGAKAVKEPFDRIIDEVTHLIVDLSAVNYIASVGVGVLLSVAQDLDEKNGRLVLAAPSDTVRETLGLMKIDDVIKITDTVEEAAAALRP